MLVFDIRSTLNLVYNKNTKHRKTIDPYYTVSYDVNIVINLNCETWRHDDVVINNTHKGAFDQFDEHLRHKFLLICNFQISHQFTSKA